MLHMSDAGIQAGDHLGTDRQLGGTETQRFTCHIVRHAVDFEQDTARVATRGQWSTAPLPLPIRTSAGLPVTGRSGKTRIQTRP